MEDLTTELKKLTISAHINYINTLIEKVETIVSNDQQKIECTELTNELTRYSESQKHLKNLQLAIKGNLWSLVLDMLEMQVSTLTSQEETRIAKEEKAALEAQTKQNSDKLFEASSWENPILMGVVERIYRNNSGLSSEVITRLKSMSPFKFGSMTKEEILAAMKIPTEIYQTNSDFFENVAVSFSKYTDLKTVEDLNTHLATYYGIDLNQASESKLPTTTHEYSNQVRLFERDRNFQELRTWLTNAHRMFTTDSNKFRTLNASMLCAGAPGTGKTALGYHFLRETLVEFFQELNNSNNNNNTNNSNNNSSSSNSSSDTGNGNNDTINSASNHTTIKNHHTIALFCTLNNDTCFDEAFESTRHPESSLAWRMLLAYFGRAEFLRETASLTTLVALEFIAQYERKAKNLQNTHIAFGLVVDEFQKALEAKVQPKYDSEYAQLTNKNVKNRRFLKLMFQQLILNASSTFKKHNYTYYLMLCGTSLLEGSTCFSINTKDGSAFSCDTISPQLLTPKGVFSFASHSIKEGILWQTNTRIRYQLALSSGQPRALDHYFYRINTYGTTKDAEFLKVINTPKPGEEAFLGSFDRLIALSFLEVPVRNDTVYYEAEGIEWTVDHAVRIGFCTKIDTGESYRITVPYLNVVFYCEEISNKRKHQGAIYLGVVDNFKAAINELIQLFKSDSTPVTDFQDFEKCTACMVLIRRLSKLILALSNSAKEEFFFTFPYKELFNNISNKLDNIKIRMSSNTTLSQKALNKLQSTKDVQDLSKDDMFVCSQHQRAIDFVSILELEHGGSFFELGQCKQRTVAYTLSASEISQFITKIGEAFPGLKGSYLLLTDARVVDSSDIPNNTVLLTLGTLPNFFTSFFHLIHFQYSPNVNMCNVNILTESLNLTGLNKDSRKGLAEKLMSKRPFRTIEQFIEELETGLGSELSPETRQKIVESFSL